MSDQQQPRPNRGRAAGPGNRRALIAAAREIYAAEGLDAPFSSIARRAGVGQGSLYRHFPDRVALAVAVFDDNIAALEELTAAEDSTVDDLLDAVAEQAVASTALLKLVTADLGDARVIPLGERFSRMVGRLVARDRAAGRLGEHVEAADVELAVRMLATELASSGAAPGDATRARALFAAAFVPR